MTAFGGVFRSPKLEGVEEGEDSGQRARLVGLDLDSGVVRVQASRPAVERADDGDDEPEGRARRSVRVGWTRTDER